MTVGDMKRIWQHWVAAQEIVLGHDWLMEISSQHNKHRGVNIVIYLRTKQIRFFLT